MTKMIRMSAVLAATALLFAACAGAQKKPDAASAKPAAAAAAAPAPIETGLAVDTEPDVRDKNLRAIPGVKTIRFAYDSDALDESARADLKANAEALKSQPGMKVQVAGHCDQRGTVAYNLALGQRRAKAVRDYYKFLGIQGKRIATISWGKERPLCPDSTDECWASNRRAETREVIASPKPVAP